MLPLLPGEKILSAIFKKLKRMRTFLRKKWHRFVASFLSLSTSFFRCLLFWSTRPIARVIIYTGSLHTFMKKNLDAAKINKLSLLQLGGEELSLMTQDDRLIDAMFFDVTKIYSDNKYYSEENRPTVIYCLGNSMLYENSQKMITFYLKRGVDVMVFNYGGYGLSQGSPRVRSTYHDVMSAYLYIKEQRSVPDKRIIVHGFSIGGGPATYLASKYPVDLVLDRTYSKLGGVVGGRLGKITDYLYPYDNVSRIRHIKGRIHIIDAANDEIMSRHHVQELFMEVVRTRHPEAHGSEIETLKEQYITVIPSGHTDCWLTDPQEIYTEEQKKFFKHVLHPLREDLAPAEGMFRKLWQKMSGWVR